MTQRRLVVALALAAWAMAVAAGLGVLPLGRTIDWKIYDLQLRRAADPAAARRDIVVVRIDERSIREMEPFVGRWPWPRLVHAKVVDFLARGGARTIVYDVLFTEHDRRRAFDVGPETWSGEESDGVFADAVARAGNVVVLADATYEGSTRQAGAEALPLPGYELDIPLDERPSVGLPYPALGRAARALGHNLLVLDPDGPLRRHVPFVGTPPGVMPSLPLAAVIASQRLAARDIGSQGDSLRIGASTVPLVLERPPSFDRAAGATRPAGRVLIDFGGPAVLSDGTSTVYREYSALDLLQAEEQIVEGQPPVLDPSTFKDKIVVVGVTAAGLHDVFAVPFSTGGKMTGAVVHANVIDQVLSKRFRREAAGALRFTVLAMMAALGAFAFTFLPVRWAVVAGALGTIAFATASQRLFSRGVWLPVALPLLGLALSSVGGLGFRYVVEGREKRAVKQLFSRYLSRDVYEQVIANPALAELGGKRRDMSVLFSDIRGFTTFTEQGRPEAVVEQLNEYFSRMVDVVFAHRGTLDKFVGDMVMALFGAPLDDARHAEHAVDAALAMTSELDTLNREWAARGLPALAIGIGVNSGEMIAGNIGSERVRSYTVIGDAVNLGSRLQSLNKDYGTTIIVSEGTAGRLQKRYDLRPLGTVVVKGRSQPVAIYEVRGAAGEPPGSGSTQP